MSQSQGSGVGAGPLPPMSPARIADIYSITQQPQKFRWAVKCPTCGVNLNQNGTNLDAIQLLRMYLAEVVGLRAEMDRMVSESWQEGWQDAVQCLQQARTMLGDIGLPLDEVIDNGIDWLEGDAVVDV